ncbi:MAG TPA: phosphate ABC transporter substrate-binding protein PstS [Ignavibacteria bacterium]
MRNLILVITIFTLLISSIVFNGCGKGDKDKSAKEILGAGATFPYPLYSKMFDAYGKEKGVKVNYQSVGSGAGIQQLTSKTVDFGASDAFMSDEEMSKAPAKVVHIPICLGAVTVVYNLEGITTLKLSPDVLSDIFLGKIKKWDDEKIKSINPDAKLPGKEINVVHRSDGSGTSFIFTDYLSKVNEGWKSSVGTGKSVNWPVGLGAKGNEGVGGLVKQTPASIGYVELIYALQNNMPMASLKNKKGNFIAPTLKSTNAAANVSLPEDTRVSLTNSDADEGYPIVSFTWILLYQEQKYENKSEEKARELLKLLSWMAHEGQQYAEPLSYAILSTEAVKKADAILKSVTYAGKPLL